MKGVIKMDEMSDKLYELLMKLPKKNLINLMWGALDEMQAYNGRSRKSCILEAMGAEYIENMKTGGVKYKLPKFKEIREITENMGL
jgi:hypothetical protein